MRGRTQQSQHFILLSRDEALIGEAKEVLNMNVSYDLEDFQVQALLGKSYKWIILLCHSLWFAQYIRDKETLNKNKHRIYYSNSHTTYRKHKSIIHQDIRKNFILHILYYYIREAFKKKV